MYGFVNYALEQLVLRNFGEKIWAEIKSEAGVEIEGNFMIRIIYNDEDTYALVVAASKVLKLPASAILELFGQFFFEFCVESGFDRILGLLGATTKDFLENLDALHDHLSMIYPGMKAPTFRCTERDDGALILHYYSDRPGLEFIVIGLVKAVALKLHKNEVDCKVIKAKDEGKENHVQFEIVEKNKEANQEKKNLMPTLANKFFSNKLKFNSSFLSRTFPFHIIFDREMRIIQCGDAIARAIPEVRNPNSKITDMFNISRPHITFDYNSIYSQIMSIFVLSTKPGVLDIEINQSNETASTMDEKDVSTRFKGQMMVIKDDLMLFQCSPSVTSINDLVRRHFFLSDIPMYDATRDLVLMNEHWENEWNLTQNLEILTDRLKRALEDLETEKKKTDNLLYSVLPSTIANELRHNRPVVPARYEQCTVMFCGIKDFSQFCTKHSEDSHEIVNLLNVVFTKIDEKTQNYPEIYKVETVGDKYMAVCGLPQKVSSHTRSMCELALDIIDTFKGVCNVDGEEIVITIGINCGEVVTGVIGKRVPRYCLFGDTVNLTSRCETTGKKGKINISEYAQENLMKPENYNPNFQLDCVGEVAMKGKAKAIKMWLLSRK